MSGTERRVDGLGDAFRAAFGAGPRGVWTAPGRINLIGEHTDYNDGFVLPFALPHTLTAAASARSDGTARLRSRQSPEAHDVALADLDPGRVRGWAAYPCGALWVLHEEGYPVTGLDLLVDSTIPTGAGLSSSAALSCATVMAAAELHGAALAPAEVARLAQRVENDFVGMPCGIMDQSASMLSTEGHALFMDTRSLEAVQVPFDPAARGLTVLVVDTRAPHRLVEGHYADRRRSCEAAARSLGVAALRDVGDLAAALDALPDEVSRRRVRHVVTENARVLRAVDLLRAGDLRAVGPLLTASHASLRDDYEVSVAEVDTAVEALLAAGALGARITGGGFGGCVVALVESDRVEVCAKAVREAYRERGFSAPEAFGALPSAGARRLA
ncbi:galactokinase [Nocardiopsis sp. FR6]|uniref:galactokinase n=1 Tax=unclassified Nocardiopsis TaxID=2649073 RepID=UPI00351A1091